MTFFNLINKNYIFNLIIFPIKLQITFMFFLIKKALVNWDFTSVFLLEGLYMH